MSEARCTLEAGALLRGTLRRSLRAAAHNLRVDLSLEEERSWLGSTFLLRWSGNPDAVERFRLWVASIDEDS